MIPRVLKPHHSFTNRLLYQLSYLGACSTVTSAQKTCQTLGAGGAVRRNGPAAGVRGRGVGAASRREALAAAARSARSRNYSARDGVHQPGDAQANQHEQREGPQHISHAARTRALREARQRQRNQQREQKHRAKMAEPQHTIEEDESATNHSASPAGRDLDRIQHRQQVHHARRSDEARAVISRSSRNIRTRGLEKPRKIIEHARPGIRQKTERAEWIARMWRKHIAAQQISTNDESGDRTEKYQRSAPAPQEQMSEAGHNPRGDSPDQDARGAPGMCAGGLPIPRRRDALVAGSRIHGRFADGTSIA